MILSISKMGFSWRLGGGGAVIFVVVVVFETVEHYHYLMCVSREGVPGENVNLRKILARISRFRLSPNSLWPLT